MPIGSSPGNVFHVPCIGQTRSDSVGFQNVVERNPINAGRFHGYGCDSAGFQPLDHRVQIFSERIEYSHWAFVAVGRHGHKNLPRSNIDAASVRLQTRPVFPTHPLPLFPPAGLSHRFRLVSLSLLFILRHYLSLLWLQATARSRSKRVLFGSESTYMREAVTTVWRTKPGTKLSIGLRTTAPLL